MLSTWRNSANRFGQPSEAHAELGVHVQMASGLRGAIALEAEIDQLPIQISQPVQEVLDQVFKLRLAAQDTVSVGTGNRA